MGTVHGDSWEERMAMRAAAKRPLERPRDFYVFDDRPEGPARCCREWRWFGTYQGWHEVMICGAAIGGCRHEHHEGEIFMADCG